MTRENKITKTKSRYQHFSCYNTFTNNYPFACFNCREVLRKPVVNHKVLEVKRFCPKCKKRIWFTGTAFKAPRKNDLKQWKKAEELITNGIIFYPHGGVRPENLREVEAFIDKYDGWKMDYEKD